MKVRFTLLSHFLNGKSLIELSNGQTKIFNEEQGRKPLANSRLALNCSWCVCVCVCVCVCFCVCVFVLIKIT